MSRTWREIPYRSGTKVVRDKDNHGCTYSCPKHHRKRGIKRRRAEERNELRKIEQHVWNNPTDKIVDDLDIVLPLEKEFREYYW